MDGTHEVHPPDIGLAELGGCAAGEDGADTLGCERGEEVVERAAAACVVVRRLCDVC